MSERRYRRFLTPESHYEMVLRADAILNNKDVDGLDNIVILPAHEQIIKMFAYHGMNAHEIARTGKVIGKRGPMKEDMISLWIKRFFPNLQYINLYKYQQSQRASNHDHIEKMRKAKEQLLRKAPYCVICGSTENLELDHILTSYAGGSDDISNLQLLCHPCHVAKTLQEDKEFGWRKSALEKGRIEHKRRKLRS